MIWALATGQLVPEGLSLELGSGDVEGLNLQAMTQDPPWDVTAISFGALPVLADHWAVLASGASFGVGVGPQVVEASKRNSRGPKDLRGKRVALPGANTSAALAFGLYLEGIEVEAVQLEFSEIPQAVAQGKVDAGVVIHEAGLQLGSLGLRAVVDLGQWWGQQTDGLPLPLGATAVRRSLPLDSQQHIDAILRESISLALEHRQQALAWAHPKAKGLSPELLDEYIRRYVNPLTLDFGDRGEEAMRTFLQRGHSLGLIPETASRVVLVRG